MNRRRAGTALDPLPDLVPLDAADALDPDLVGHKFASLARAHRAGFAVPPALALSTALFERLYRRRWPEGAAELGAVLERAVAELDLAAGLSARSSATLEDLAGMSFAGAYETFLDLRDAAALAAAVERCWASADAETVRAYLTQKGLADARPAMAVVLQQMVHARAAGVAFSRDPLAPARREVVLEAVAGLGEKLVSGHVTPERYRVGQDDQPRRQAAAGSGMPEAEPVLDEAAARRVAALARQAEERFGAPQDIEWAIDDAGMLWLLQARPVTALAAAPESAAAAPAGRWTRHIAVDLWGDRLTPYLADAMLRQAPRYDLSASARRLGVPVVQPALAVIDGFLYVNGDSLAAAFGALPRRLRLADLAVYLPPDVDLAALPAPTPGRLLRLAFGALWLGVSEPRTNPLFCAALTRRRLTALEADRPAPAAEPLGRVRQAAERLARLQEINQFPYLHATLLTLLLRWLVVERAGASHAAWLGLLAGTGDNVTSRIEARLKRLAADIGRRPELAERFVAAPESTPLPTDLAPRLERFLADYGARSRHRALPCPRWAEEPAEVLGLLAALVRQVPADGVVEREVEPAAVAWPETLRWYHRLLAAPLRRWALRYLDLREELRFTLDRILFDLRRALLDLGAATGLDEAVFFLTDAELAAVVAVGAPTTEQLALVDRRRTAFAAPAGAAMFYLDRRPIEALPAAADRLTGVGTSAGRARGRARVVDDPATADLRRGDILVARHTDPGWTPVLSVVAAVVVEEGGLLNHCSIVARELGIPAVVGVAHATTAITDGCEVTVDGDLGLVLLAR